MTTTTRYTPFQYVTYVIVSLVVIIFVIHYVFSSSIVKCDQCVLEERVRVADDVEAPPDDSDDDDDSDSSD